MALCLLILGDGDLSFTATLVSRLREDQETDDVFIQTYLADEVKEVIATTFDGRDAIKAKYGDTALRAAYDLASASGTPILNVRHAVDATDWPADLDIAHPLVVVWNHPHSGVEDCKRHRSLLEHFFHRCAAAGAAEVIISLLPEQVERWGALDAAQRQMPNLKLVRRVRHSPNSLYKSVRNLTACSFQTRCVQRSHGVCVRNSDLLVWSTLRNVAPDVDVSAVQEVEVEVPGLAARFMRYEDLTAMVGAGLCTAIEVRTALVEANVSSLSATAKRTRRKLLKYSEATLFRFYENGGFDPRVASSCPRCDREYDEAVALNSHHWNCVILRKGEGDHVSRRVGVEVAKIPEVPRSRLGNLCHICDNWECPKSFAPCVQDNLVCEYCGATLRGIRALAQHKLSCTTVKLSRRLSS